MSDIVVVDTNIIFAALYSGSSRIPQELTRENTSFITPSFTIVEIFKHSPRLQKNSNLSLDEILDQLSFVLEEIDFVRMRPVAIGSWLEARRLCKGVDPNDIAFVALALEKSAALWTYDRELKMHLEKNGFNNFFNNGPLLTLNVQ